MKTRKKILFIALAQSTHTHAWINLLTGLKFQVRLIGITRTKAPKDFKFPTYTFDLALARREELRLREKTYFQRLKNIIIKEKEMPFKTDQELEDEWLANIIKSWKPNIIHTLGFDPAGYEYLRVKNTNNLSKIGIWLATVRGGPELALNHLLPSECTKIKKILQFCDQLIADNIQNYEIAVELGLAPNKISPLGVIPGTGGVDIEELSKMRKTKASQSRIILWPKAYECLASKASPVFEALKIAWKKIQPCEIYMTGIIPETALWFQALPAEIKNACKIFERMPRKHLLELMTRARVVLAPSLADGIPNILYEAMATGALPVLSPLETIKNVVTEKNALFARNLYPEEIATALVKAMNDNALVDQMTKDNFVLVKKIANRKILAQKVSRYYNELLRTKNKLDPEG